MKFYQELFPLEAELPDLGPGEGVDLGEVLEDEDPHVGHRQAQAHTLVVLHRKTSHTPLWSYTENTSHTPSWSYKERLFIHPRGPTNKD